MKITRNGIEIELTTEEMRKAYWECYWLSIEYAIENRDKEMIL